MEKVIIVEGKTDKERLMEILDEPVEIACTNGTLSYEKLEELLIKFRDYEVYVLADADEPGNKMRSQIKREFPDVHNLFTERTYREVATTPIEVLGRVLERAHFQIKSEYQIGEFES